MFVRQQTMFAPACFVEGAVDDSLRGFAYLRR